MSLNNTQRISAAHLAGRPVQEEARDGWPVVLEYADEGPGPWLVDLSHCMRVDIQGRPMDGLIPYDIAEPANPGDVSILGMTLVARMGPAQAGLWCFDPTVEIAPHFNRTQITEGTLGLALLGRNSFRIAEKLTSLDLAPPRRKPPFLVQGPFCHVPCQLLVLQTAPGSEMLVLSCSRGYGRDMVHAIQEAGDEFGLRPAGENRFVQMFAAAGAGRPVA